ncbi:uncharacterized protein [Dipodomys merriami]|uniref:uncharacterized protein n=1 Tax=Dipodomys merriami TaxID=94247 RepID=UPI003855DCED
MEDNLNNHSPLGGSVELQQGDKSPDWTCKPRAGFSPPRDRHHLHSRLHALRSVRSRQCLSRQRAGACAPDGGGSGAPWPRAAPPRNDGPDPGLPPTATVSEKPGGRGTRLLCLEREPLTETGRAPVEEGGEDPDAASDLSGKFGIAPFSRGVLTGAIVSTNLLYWKEQDFSKWRNSRSIPKRKNHKNNGKWEELEIIALKHQLKMKLLPESCECQEVEGRSVEQSSLGGIAPEKLD